jgi:hypothetical protein
MNRYILSFFLLTFLVCDCDRDKKTDCSVAICTDEFRFITILIKHSTDSSAVILTGYKVFRVSDNKDITISNDLNFPPGYYPLVSDSQLALLRNSTVEIEFQGFVQNLLIIKKRFVVGADCCHVSLVSGESVVYI